MRPICGITSPGLPALRGAPGRRSRLPGKLREVGDGNLNLVFIVEGSVRRPMREAGAALCAPGWRRLAIVDLKRAWFEHPARHRIQSRHAVGLLPELLHFDERLFLIAMECWPPPTSSCGRRHDRRRGLSRGCRRAHHRGIFATTLFYTSDMALPAAEKRSS